MKKLVFVLSLSIFLTGCKISTDTTHVEKNSETSKVSSERTNKMDSKTYKLAVKKAKQKGLKAKENLPEIAKITTSAFTDGILDFDDMESKTDLGIQGVIIDSNPYIDIEENLEEAHGRTKLTVLVNEVLYGDQSLVGQTITIYQPTGFVKKRQLGLQNKFPDMSEEELNETMLSEVNGIGPADSGVEFVGYLVQSLENDTPVYGFYGINLTRFDKDEETNQYEQVVEPTLKDAPADSDFAESNTLINEEINKIVTE